MTALRLGQFDLPELEEERKKRAADVLALYDTQACDAATRGQTAAARHDPTIGASEPGFGYTPPSAFPRAQVDAAAATGRGWVDAARSRWEDFNEGRSALANIWVTGLRGAHQTRMDKMATDAAAQYEKMFAGRGGGGGGGGGGRGGGGGGGRRRSSGGRSSSGGGGGMQSAGGGPDSWQVAAQWILDNTPSNPPTPPRRPATPLRPTWSPAPTRPPTRPDALRGPR